MDPWSERELWVWGWGNRQNDRENVRKALYLLLCVTSPLTLMPCWTCVESININCVPKVRSTGLGLWSSEDKCNQSRMEVGQRRHDHQEDKRRKGTTLLSASSKLRDRQDGGWLCNSSNRSAHKYHWKEEYWHCPFWWESIPEVVAMWSNRTRHWHCLDRDIFVGFPHTEREGGSEINLLQCIRSTTGTRKHK